MMIRNATALQTICLSGVLLFSLAGCSNQKVTEARNITYNMGERVEVKGVVYSVLDAEWLPSIGEGADQKLPKHRFLVLRVAITNGTGAQVNVPFLSLEGGKGDPIMEVDDAKGLPQWLGIVRLVNPAQTEDGKREIVIVGSLDEISQLAQNAVRKAGLPAQVDVRPNEIRIAAKSKEGDAFTVVLTRTQNAKTEQVRVRIEGEKQLDPLLTLQILTQIEASSEQRKTR